MNLITETSGAEGPKHDPYAWTKLIVRGRHGTTVLHHGMGTWCLHKETGKRADGEEGAYTFFEMLVGVSPRAARKAYHRLVHLEPLRRHNAKCPERKRFECVEGMPGESMLICGACGTMVACDFDEGAVL